MDKFKRIASVSLVMAISIPLTVIGVVCEVLAELCSTASQKLNELI